MFNNKIINIITRTLGAIFLLMLFCLIIGSFIGYSLQTVSLIIIGYVIYLTIVGIICICIAEFITWIFDKLDK